MAQFEQSPSLLNKVHQKFIDGTRLVMTGTVLFGTAAAASRILGVEIITNVLDTTTEATGLTATALALGAAIMQGVTHNDEASTVEGLTVNGLTEQGLFKASLVSVTTANAAGALAHIDRVYDLSDGGLFDFETLHLVTEASSVATLGVVGTLLAVQKFNRD